MADEFKSVKDNLIRSVISAISSGQVESTINNAPSGLREVISSLATIAGKGKDEMVQIISREIGLAIAGILREPLTQVMQRRNIKITIEFEPETDKPKVKSKKRTPTKKKSKRTRS